MAREREGEKQGDKAPKWKLVMTMQWASSAGTIKEWPAGVFTFRTKQFGRRAFVTEGRCYGLEEAKKLCWEYHLEARRLKGKLS